MTTTVEKKPNEQKVIDALGAEEATVDEIAAAAGIGHTSTRKYLADLGQGGMARRAPGGREGKRKLPDRYSLVVEDGRPAVAKGAKVACGDTGQRLRPGGLDELVLGYLRDHRERGPFGPTAVAKGLGRSSGAVANSLARMASAGEKVEQVGGRPRRYVPKEGE
jgi:hypothetical protein